MKRVLSSATLIFILVSLSCLPKEDLNTRFESLANNYIKKILSMNPEWATQLGDHRLDGKLNDRSSAKIKETLMMNRQYLDSLHAIDARQLNQVNQIDYQIMKRNIQSEIFSIDTLQGHIWNPMYYNIGSAINDLVARDFAPLKERLLSLKERLIQIPLVLDHARQNLLNPPKIFTETAIIQNRGVISLVRDDLNTFIEQVPELKPEFIPILDKTVAALQEYNRWLENDLLPRSNGDFRMGKDKFVKKLHYALDSDLSKDEILLRAITDLKFTKEELFETALPLYNKYFSSKARSEDKKFVIKSVLNKLAENRPNNETIVAQAKECLAACTDFVSRENLVNIPDDPIKIIVMPEFQRGIAVAYCDAPGPLEEMGETFFSISPTPSDWSEQRVTSFFKEYNNYMLYDLTIHEAMPGHYLQLAHANQFKAPTKIRMIFYSGTFVEGWATYAEQLMVEKGFGGAAVKMQQLKMRLRLLINAIIDQKIHTKGMSEQEAMDLMMQEGFQEEGEAAGKWRRACLSSTQLSTYYVGNIEVNDLRRSYQEKKGAEFDLKEFHDRLLSFGSIAPRYIQRLLKD